MRTVILAAAAALALASAADAGDTVTLQALGDVHPGTVRLAHADPDSGHAYPQASAVEQPMENRTAVDHRFTPDGLTASAGYLCGIGGIGPDTDGTRGGPSSAFQHYGTFLGATIGYPLP